MYSSNIETLFHSHSLRVEYIFNLVLNSVMNCENIHKKHNGSHLSNFSNQKSWSEIQFELVYYSLVKCTAENKFKPE